MVFRILLLIVLFSRSAFAGPLTINLSSSLLTALDGETVTFSGSITNTSGTEVFINGDSSSISSPLIVDDTKFFLNSPLSIGPSVTTPTFEMFDVKSPLGAPSALYSGAFDILGGTSRSSFDVVGTATFAVNVVQSVPEPATLALVGLGLGGLGFWRRNPAMLRNAGPHALRVPPESRRA
jgi:hypothetical protein